MAKITKPKKSIISAKDLRNVQEHYEDYPYPLRDPEDEAKRLMQLEGDFLGEINHWLYKGKENFNSGFRCLIAGGGTGDSLIFLAEQLKNFNAEIVYLDFSKASMEVAQKRAEKRGLTNIRWIHDSIYHIPKLNLGKFDYINCIGVLHHLTSPPEGLKILQESLTEKGGMHLMIYAKYGRSGVYQIQELMKMVNKGVTTRAEEISNANHIMNILPASNWFMLGGNILADHKLFGDIGLYDMCLHKQDRAYSIPEMYEFVHDAGLNFVDYTSFASRVVLSPRHYITDAVLLEKIQQMDLISQQAICEILVGNIIKHAFYVSSQKNTVASLDDLNNVPYFYLRPALPQELYNYLSNNPEHTSVSFKLDINQHNLKDINITFPVSVYTKYIFKNIIEGEKSWQEIFDAIRKELGSAPAPVDVSDATLLNEVKRIFFPFLSTVMLLRDKSTGPFKLRG